MLWTIVKRELADHLSSFRFSAIFVFILLLMLGSALVTSSTYNREVREYPPRVDQLVNEDGKVNLGTVACLGGITVRRRPSLLAFCSGTGERQLPNEAVMAVHGLRAVQRTADIGEILSGSADLDWAFIIASLFSFAAGLLTYKSVSGERRDGTLALVLSQPISRSTVLMGKYLAALIVLSAVFVIAVLTSLLVLQSLNAAPLTGNDWLKIGFFGFISIAYLSVFILIGLLCSVLTQGPLLSAVAFMFVWTGLVFVIPNLGGVLAGQIGDVMTPLQARELANAIPDQLSPGPGMNDDEVASVKLQRELARERLLREYLQSLARQVHLGQNLTRISPSSAYSYAAENHRRRHVPAHAFRRQCGAFSRRLPPGDHRGGSTGPQKPAPICALVVRRSALLSKGGRPRPGRGIPRPRFVKRRGADRGLLGRLSIDDWQYPRFRCGVLAFRSTRRHPYAGKLK